MLPTLLGVSFFWACPKSTCHDLAVAQSRGIGSPAPALPIVKTTGELPTPAGGALPQV